MEIIHADTPQTRLEQACRLIDVDKALAALAEGADADAMSQDDQTPLTILVVLNPEGGSTLARKAQILKALFEAGARKDPDYSPDEGIVSCGIEALIENSFDRVEYAGWDENAEIALLDTWLEAGNNPNPVVMVDGRLKPLVRSLCFMFDEMKQWTREGEEEKLAETGRYIHRLIGVLHAHGCPLNEKILTDAGFEPSDVVHILGRSRAEVDDRALQAGTAAVKDATAKSAPRL